MADGFSLLLWDLDRKAAVDLKIYHRWVQQWFAGLPLYTGPKPADYPPASFALLWPLLGWPELELARWLWAIASAAALSWLVWLAVRYSGATTALERAFVALLPLVMNATRNCLANGQLVVLLLPMLLTATVLLGPGRRGTSSRLLAALLFLPTLVKPTVSAPFFWLLPVLGRAVWPAALVVGGYAGLALVAASFQAPGVIALHRDWLSSASLRIAGDGVQGGYGNLHNLVVHLGWSGSVIPAASLLLVLGLGAWLHRHRDADPWLLTAVTAVVARLWAHHWLYDDLLILVAILALFRIVKLGPHPDGRDAAAAALLAVVTFVMIPDRPLSWPAPWSDLFKAGRTTLWLAVLAFLMIVAGRTTRRVPDAVESPGDVPDAQPSRP
jgi:hypothetical protein